VGCEISWANPWTPYPLRMSSSPGSWGRDLPPSTTDPPGPLRDPERLRAIRGLGLLDSPSAEAFDRLTRLAARFLRTPVSLATLVLEDRQVFLGQTGLAEPWTSGGEMPLEYSYCQHALGSEGPLLIEDARQDPRVQGSPAISENQSIAYAGVPLVTEEGHALGTLCVVDRRPRAWTEEEVQILRDLAASAMTEVELRRELAQRARAETVLRRQNELLELAHDGILVRALDDTIVYWNRGAERAYGWTREEALGRKSHDLLRTEIPRPLEEVEQELRDTGQWEGDLVHTTREGERLIVASRWALQRDDAGEPAAVLEINRDTSKRRKAEAALRRAHDRLEEEVRERTAELRQYERRFRALVENASEIFTILAADGSVRYESPAILQALGYAPEELVGRNVFELVHPEDLPRVREVFEHVVEEATRRSVEFRFRHKDGSYRLLHSVGTSLLAEPAVAGVVMNSLDVTELRKSEARLRQAQKMEAVGRLAGGIAHDFNNVLLVIKGRSGLALMDLPEDTPLREDLQEIDHAADRAANLTRQLLAFSRQQVLQPQVINLNHVVAEMERILRRTLGEDIEFVTVLDPQLGRVEADAGQVEQILMNLAVNARDAMPTGGKLITETQNVELSEDFAGRYGYEVQPGRYVLLSVSDTGTGMSPEIRERIFEPFFTTKKGQGTGMGLSTVYGIVKQSGGYIWVYSEEGRGTSFKIYLPRVDIEAERPVHGPAPEAPRRSATILLVEDEVAVRATARRMLERMGHTVLEASNGEEALRVHREHSEAIDILLTDVVMPIMGGRELAERLREERPDLRVLYTSGYTDEAVVRHGIVEGSAAFLQKPYQPAALAEKVADVLGGEDE
jgi:two-component system cell cycle sensor histidine kinase/response regulator CckA